MTNAPKLPLWVIALGTGSAVMGITLITPALPAIVSALNVLPEKVQQLLTFYLAMLALGQLAIGPLSDVFGRRIFFITGAFLIGASGLVASFISQIDVLIFLRAIQGLGAAACISMGRTMVNDFFSRADAQKAMASVQTIQAIVPMISLSCGGAIVFYAGWEGIMILISLAGIVLFLCSLILLPETNVSKRPELNLSAILMGYKSVLKNRLFRAYLSVSSLQIAAFFALNAFIPYAYQKVGSTSLTFGLWFALTPLAYITGNLVNRLYMIKKGLETGILVGCSLSVLSMILMLALNLISWQHPLSLAIPCIMFGFANGLTIANATIGGLGAVSSHAGTASGLIGSVTMILGGIGGAVLIFFGADKTTIIGIAGLLCMLAFSLVSAVKIFRHST